MLFLLLALRHPVAADSYFSIPGCPDDPAKLCLTGGDGVNTVVPLSQTDTTIAQTAAQLLGPKNAVMSWFGELKPLKSYQIGTDKLNAYAAQHQAASDLDLNPAYLQSIETHDTPKSFSMTSRECVYNPQTGELIGNFVSGDTVVTGEVPWIAPGVEGARRLASFTTGYVQESQDFRLQNISIRHDAALPCSAKLSGETKAQQPLPYQFENTYGSGPGSAITKFVYTITAGMIKVVTNNDGTTTAQAKAPVPAHIVGTGQDPYAHAVFSLGPGCVDESDLNAVGYASDAQKKKLCGTGGFINSMFRPDAFDPSYKSDLGASDPTQQWEQTITGDKPVAANSNAFAGRIEAAEDYESCTLHSADQQTTVLPGVDCSKNMVGASQFAAPPVAPFLPGIPGEAILSPSPLPTPGACPIDQIAAGTFKPADTSCKLCGADKLGGFLKNAFPVTPIYTGLSPLAQKIIEAAGAAYHVPASILLSTMVHEGAFIKTNGWDLSTDETVKKFSDCRNPSPMPNCSVSDYSKAQGPFGFLTGLVSDWPAQKVAITEQFPTRPTGTISPCNFVDAAFASARQLYGDSHLLFPEVSSQCISGGKTYQVYRGSISPITCGTWTAEQAALSRLQYGERSCSDQTVANNVARTVDMFKSMSCGGP